MLSLYEDAFQTQREGSLCSVVPLNAVSAMTGWVGVDNTMGEPPGSNLLAAELVR